MKYTVDNISALKGDVKAALKMWAESKVEQLFGKGSIVGHYMKRGIGNYMGRMDEQTNKAIDALSLFVADERGNIDTDAFIEDAVAVFKEMERKETLIAGMQVVYGQGEVVVTIPQSMMYDMVFGRFGTIRITADDLLELKGLMYG